MCVFKYHAFIFYIRPPRWRCKTIPSMKSGDVCICIVRKGWSGSLWSEIKCCKSQNTSIIINLFHVSTAVTNLWTHSNNSIKFLHFRDALANFLNKLECDHNVSKLAVGKVCKEMLSLAHRIHLFSTQKIGK